MADAQTAAEPEATPSTDTSQDTATPSDSGTEAKTKTLTQSEYDRLAGAANFERQQRERLEAEYKAKEEANERERLEEQNKFQELYEKERKKREDYERDLKRREEDAQVRDFATEKGAPEFADLFIAARSGNMDDLENLFEKYQATRSQAVASDVEKRLDTGTRATDSAAPVGFEPASWQQYNDMSKAEILKRREARIKAGG